MRIRAAFASLLVATLIVLPAYAAYATDEPQDSSTTTVAPTGPVPAEEAEVEEAAEADAPWTQRFLAPTVALLAAITVGGVVLYYFVRVRGRYQVVD